MEPAPWEYVVQGLLVAIIALATWKVTIWPIVSTYIRLYRAKRNGWQDIRGKPVQLLDR